jgi:hypothetical protein
MVYGDRRADVLEFEQPYAEASLPIAVRAGISRAALPVLRKRRPDLPERPLEISHDELSLNVQHSVPSPPQRHIPARIGRNPALMIPTIDLDDEPRLGRDQINDETVEHAATAANQYISDQLGQAHADYELYRNASAAGNRFGAQFFYDRAMTHLGYAIHVIQDAACPAHMGFQEWNGRDPIGMALHTLRESRPRTPGNRAIRDAMGGTRWAFGSMISGRTFDPAIDRTTGTLRAEVAGTGSR